MTWLLELLFDSLRTMLAQFVVDLMDTVTGVFTDLMCCDLSLFEDLFSVAGQLYQNAVMPFAVALLAMICVWQLFKTMFGRVGTGAEEPVELVGRSVLCLFCIVYSKRIVDYLLMLAGTPYQWIVGNGVEIESFSGFVSAAELAAAPLGLDRLSLQLLLLVMQLIVAWNYFKLLYVVAERYVLLGIFSYTAPLAFATGGAKATNQILANWSKAFGGQLVLILLDGWGLKMFLSAYGNLLASRHGFTRFFVGCMCLVGFSKIIQKLDSYLASLGANLGRTNAGMSGVAAAVMAGRLAGQAGKTVFGQAAAGGSGSPIGGREGFGGSPPESSGVVEGQPIPMQSEQNRTGGSQEAFQANPGVQGMSGNFSGTGVKHESGEAGTEADRKNDTGKETGENRKKEREVQEEAGCYSALSRIVQEGTGIYDTGMASCEEETASMEEEREALEAAAMEWEQEMPEDAAAYDTGMMSMQEETGFDGQEGYMSEESWGQGAETEQPESFENRENGSVEAGGVNYGESRNRENIALSARENRGIGIVSANSGTAAVGGLADMKITGTGSIQQKPRTGTGGLPKRISENPRGGQQGGMQGQGSAVESPEAVSGEIIGMDVGKAGQLAERFVQNGKLYLDAERYEAPEIPYRMESRYGGTYYTVPQSAAEGKVEATLQENGTVRYQKNSKTGWEPKRKEVHPEQQGQEERNGR